MARTSKSLESDTVVMSHVAWDLVRYHARKRQVANSKVIESLVLDALTKEV